MPVRTPQVLLGVIGLTAGFASAFLGIGGGLVIVPALMIAFEFPIKRAVGTSLLTIVPVSAIGVLTEMWVKADNIHIRMALILTAGSLAGSWIGGKLVRRIPEAPLRFAYVAFLLFVAYRMFISAEGADGSGPIAPSGAPILAGVVGGAAGILAGVSSVLFGIGGGAVMVPALSLLFGAFTFHAARATSLVTIIPTSAYGAYQHGRMGTVDVGVAKGLIALGLVGAIAGVFAVNRLPARPCRLVFAGFLVLSAARLLLTMRGAAKATGPSEVNPPASL